MVEQVDGKHLRGKPPSAARRHPPVVVEIQRDEGRGERDGRNERPRRDERRGDARRKEVRGNYGQPQRHARVQIVLQGREAVNQLRPRHSARADVGDDTTAHGPALEMTSAKPRIEAQPVAGRHEAISEIDVFDRRTAEALVEAADAAKR